MPEETPGTIPVKYLHWSIIAVVFSFITLVLSPTLAEYDLWGHLKYGLDFLSWGKIPQIDPYSYVTTGYRWIEHCWLEEIVCALAFKAAGVAGLCCLKFTFVLLIFAILFWQLLRSGMHSIHAGILISLAIMALAPGLLPLRPHLFTYFFFLLILVLINLAEQGKYKWLLVAPFIFMLWVNCHGGFLAGLNILGIWTVVHLITECVKNKNIKTLGKPANLIILAALVTSALATLINPYGFGLIKFLVASLSSPRPEITEWSPLQIPTLPGTAYLILLVLSANALVASSKRPTPALLVVFIVCAIQPLMAARHLPLFVFASLVLTGSFINEFICRVDPHAASLFDKMSPWTRKALISISAATTLCLIVLSLPSFRQIPMGNDYPINAVSILRQAGAKGNLATFFDWGEYCTWHLYPNLKVSIDGRREASYSPQAYATNLKFTYGVDDWDQLLEKYPTDLVLANKNMATYNLMKLEPNWQLVFEDKCSGLYARKNTIWISKLSNIQPAPEHPGFFP